VSEKFDYVIVGAGSAGCVLANRLTEDGNVKVLVLEAGGAATGLFKDMPVAFPNYVLRRDLNWNFESEPEPYLAGRKIEIPRGKGLGGSSIINGMVYARGHRRDYDDWARRGLVGWSYADVLPYFRKSEKSWMGENTYHGNRGELEVRVPASNMLYDEIRAASIAAGYPATDDYHGADSEGFQRNEMTVTRSASASRAGAPSASTMRSAARFGRRSPCVKSSSRAGCTARRSCYCCPVPVPRNNC
jgi:choline dehydrogenase